MTIVWNLYFILESHTLLGKILNHKGQDKKGKPYFLKNMLGLYFITVITYFLKKCIFTLLTRFTESKIVKQPGLWSTVSYNSEATGSVIKEKTALSSKSAWTKSLFLQLKKKKVVKNSESLGIIFLLLLSQQCC